MSFADQHHFRKRRDSGHPAVTHDYHVGYILAYWGLGDNAVITGICHDLLEDSEQKGVSYKRNKEIRVEVIDEINKSFGAEVIIGVMALSKQLNPRHVKITQRVDEIIEQNLGGDALDKLLRSLDQHYSNLEPTEVDGVLYDQLERFKNMYPQIMHFNHTRVADNIANLLTKQYMRPKGYMTSEDRQQKFCETSKKYVLPLAREIDQSNTILNEMRIADYVKELIARIY